MVAVEERRHAAQLAALQADDRMALSTLIARK
jgi:hypothetical protein